MRLTVAGKQVSSYFITFLPDINGQNVKTAQYSLSFLHPSNTHKTVIVTAIPVLSSHQNSSGAAAYSGSGNHPFGVAGRPS